MPQWNRVTIVGLGLMGGSLGMALKRRRLAKTVVGLSRVPATLRRALRRGAIDVGTTDAARAVRDADLVILATPVDTIIPQARRLARHMKPGSILTDVGSTKTQIVARLERALPKHVAFVGGHPLAGSEARGIEAADAHLYDGAVCILTPTPRTNRAALRCVERFWKPLVGRVIRMSPREHDRTLAATSHLPHVIASCLVRTAPARTLPTAAPSFRNMTRLAKSDPDLWDDIFITNRRFLLREMDRFARQWRAFRALLAGSRRAALRRALAQAKRTRDTLEKQHTAHSTKQ